MSKAKLIKYQFEQHRIPSQEIAEHAKTIINKLQKNGYQAYLVGGAVRDLLLGLHPKDFDIATDATPEQIKQVFRRQCRIIGRRFRLAHVYMKDSLYEVATFRGGKPQGDRLLKQGQIIRDNTFGSIEEDALRRDFSCNALYYDIKTQTILDYAGGVEDIKQGRLKLIGDADRRFTEDPVRMLRAVRFQAKLGLQLSDSLKTIILANRQGLTNIPPARLFDETVKLFHCGQMATAFEELLKLKLFGMLFPAAEKIANQQKTAKNFLHNAFQNTDSRIAEGKSVTPVFLVACILWIEFLPVYQELLEQRKPAHEALHHATALIMIQQRSRVGVPRVIQSGVRQIWVMQLRFKKMFGKTVYSTLHNPRFRAAYDFLLLRNTVNQELNHQADFWTNIQNMSPQAIKSMIFGKKKRNRQITPEL